MKKYRCDNCVHTAPEEKFMAKVMIYNRHRIAWELERTAMGDGFYGNALRVAKDIPGVTDLERSLLDRYATGRNSGLADRLSLCELALKLDTMKGV